jgi:hypothetical protein
VPSGGSRRKARTVERSVLSDHASLPDAWFRIVCAAGCATPGECRDEAGTEPQDLLPRITGSVLRRRNAHADRMRRRCSCAPASEALAPRRRAFGILLVAAVPLAAFVCCAPAIGKAVAGIGADPFYNFAVSGEVGLLQRLAELGPFRSVPIR